MSPTTDAPAVGERAHAFTGLRCDGETFRPSEIGDVFADGGVLVFYGFTYSAIAENWWKRYDRRGWDEFDVPVAGVSRDGPYAQNRFIRDMDLPFSLFADVDGTAIEAYGISTGRKGMADVETARRSIFVLDEGLRVIERWISEDWISPPPVEEIEAAVERL